MERETLRDITAYCWWRSFIKKTKKKTEKITMPCVTTFSEYHNKYLWAIDWANMSPYSFTVYDEEMCMCICVTLYFMPMPLHDLALIMLSTFLCQSFTDLMPSSPVFHRRERVRDGPGAVWGGPV